MDLTSIRRTLAEATPDLEQVLRHANEDNLEPHTFKTKTINVEVEEKIY